MTHNELYHHGILGQKWGVRNGPPYPLSSSQKSSSEKKLQKKINKTSKKSLNRELRYKLYKISYDLDEKEARRSLTPTQYARWYTSGRTVDRRMTMRQLEKQSNYSREKMRKLLDKISEDGYIVVYDVVTGNYEVRKKED